MPQLKGLFGIQTKYLLGGGGWRMQPTSICQKVAQRRPSPMDLGLIVPGMPNGVANPNKVSQR